jgi:hypothetical protein
VEESASSQVVLEVWYEDTNGEGMDKKWLKTEVIGGELNLAHLRKLEDRAKLGDNAILVTLAIDPGSTYYLSLDPHAEREGGGSGSKARDAVERSRRETRMKKGVGLGGLHQYVFVRTHYCDETDFRLVNMQAVIADTQRGIAEVQAKIDKLLRRDIDGRALVCPSLRID